VKLPAAPYITRRVRLAGAGDTLSCPNGHRIRDPLVWESGALRCNARESIDSPPCNALSYLLGGGLSAPDGRPIFLLAEVTGHEMHIMRTERMGWVEAVEYLGLGAITRPLQPSRLVNQT
jgi:hypothetical protein